MLEQVAGAGTAGATARWSNREGRGTDSVVRSATLSYRALL